MAKILILGEKMEMGMKMTRCTPGKVTKLGKMLTLTWKIVNRGEGKMRDQKINIGNLNGMGRST